MWALVKSNQVVAIYNRPKAITIDGIQHPSNIFSAWTKAQKKAIGIYDYVEVGANPNSDFYTLGASTTAIDADAGTVTKTYENNAKNMDDVNEVDEDGNPVLDSDGNQIVTLGLKSIAKQKVKAQAAGLLQGSDWYVVRAAEGGAAVPDDVATYRAAVRTKSGTMETAIDGAANVAALAAMYDNTSDSDGNVTVGTLNDWPVVPDILK